MATQILQMAFQFAKSVEPCYFFIKAFSNGLSAFMMRIVCEMLVVLLLFIFITGSVAEQNILFRLRLQLVLVDTQLLVEKIDTFFIMFGKNRYRFKYLLVA